MPLADSEVVPVETWVVFGTGAESFKPMLGTEATDQLLEELRAHGLDFSKPLLAAYPAAQFEAWVEIAARGLFPTEPPALAQRRLGRRFFDGWKGTLIGEAATAFLRVVGPRRAVGRIGRVFRHGNNFTVTHVEPQGDARAIVDFAQTQDIPDFVAGIIDAALDLMRVRGEVVIVSRGVRQFVLDISWAALGTEPAAPG